MKSFDQIGILVYKEVRLDPTNGLLCSQQCPHFHEGVQKAVCTLQGSQGLRKSYGRFARTFICRKGQIHRSLIKGLSIVVEYDYDWSKSPK